MNASSHQTLDRSYLRRGLAAMARAQESGNGNFGHYGAGLLAAWFLSEEHALDPAALAGLTAQCERFIAQNQTFFVPYPVDALPVDTERRLIAALETNLDRLCAIGHNVIFAAHALRAVRTLGHGLGEAETASLCNLITGLSFTLTMPSRSTCRRWKSRRCDPMPTTATWPRARCARCRSSTASTRASSRAGSAMS